MKSVAMKSVLLGALGIASATYHPDEAKNEWKMDHNTGNVAGEAKNDWKMDHKTENVAGEAAEWNAVDMPYEAPKADVKLAPEHMLEGAKDNENVYVVAANWGGDNGETKVADPSAGGATHEVVVGGDELVYTPASIVAAVGDKVHFSFMAKNHSITQSSFDKPCVKLATGVDSGLLPNPDGTMSPPPSFVFEVKNTAPAWFYCKQRTGTHCGKGMVFSINPSAEKTHDIFKQSAMKQNGTEASDIVADPAADVAASSSTVAVETESTTLAAATTTDNVLDVTTTSTMTIESDAAVPSATGVNLVQGAGGEGGACSCTCLCGAESFPSKLGQGHWGGWGGAIPMQGQWDAAPADAAPADAAPADAAPAGASPAGASPAEGKAYR